MALFSKLWSALRQHVNSMIATSCTLLRVAVCVRSLHMSCLDMPTQTPDRWHCCIAGPSF